MQLPLQFALSSRTVSGDRSRDIIHRFTEILAISDTGRTAVGYQGISVINYRSNSRVIGAPRRKRRGFGADRAAFMSYLLLQRGAERAARHTMRNHRLAGPSRICFASRVIITMRQRFAVTLMGSLDTRVSAKAGASADNSRRSESLAARSDRNNWNDYF